MKKDVVGMDRPASEERVAETERMNQRHEELIRMLAVRVARLERWAHEVDLDLEEGAPIGPEPIPWGDLD